MVYTTKQEALKQHPLFESLSWWQFRSLAKEAEVREVKKGEVILREGDKGDAFYIVLNGRCEAYRMEDGHRRRLEQYHNGDSFGETSLLSKEESWATIQALNDTLLIDIDRDTINELTKNNAGLSYKLSEKIAKRVNQKKEDYRRAATSRIVSIGSSHEEIGKTLLGINVAVALHQEIEEDVFVVDFTRHPEEDLNKIPTGNVDLEKWVEDVAREHPSGISVIPATLPEEEKKDVLGPFFSSFVSRYDYVFCLLPEGLSPTVKEVYEQSDQIFLLTDLDAQNLYQTRLLISELQDEFQTKEENLRVVLSRLSPSEMSRPSGAEDQLNYRVSYRLPEISSPKVYSPLTGNAFINRFSDHPYSVNARRIARRIGGVSVGLALGAGAARGLSHIGVIRVLEEEGIEVDFVAGTSIGALVAAGWAAGANADEMEELAYEFKRRGGLWKMTDLSFPPTQSILRDTRIMNFLNYMLDDTTFSDTDFPVRIVSANLDRLSEEVHSRGLLAEAVRESISIPIVYPPIRRNDEEIVDGGVLNPIPVNVLANEGISRIIAVNPIPPLEVLRESRHIQPVRSRGGLWNWIKRQVLPFGKGNIMDTFMRSLQAMQARLASSAAASADLVVNPIVSTEEWSEFEQVDTFIKQGEMTARNHLDEIKSIVDEKPGKRL
jgi:NTE family protein